MHECPGKTQGTHQKCFWSTGCVCFFSSSSFFCQPTSKCFHLKTTILLYFFFFVLHLVHIEIVWLERKKDGEKVSPSWVSWAAQLISVQALWSDIAHECVWECVYGSCPPGQLTPKQQRRGGGCVQSCRHPPSSLRGLTYYREQKLRAVASRNTEAGCCNDSVNSCNCQCRQHSL